MKYVVTAQTNPPQQVHVDSVKLDVTYSDFKDHMQMRAELHELFWTLHDILGLDLYG